MTTPRSEEAWSLRSRGLSNREIATEMGVSRQTVVNYLNRDQGADAQAEAETRIAEGSERLAAAVNALGGHSSKRTQNA